MRGFLGRWRSVAGLVIRSEQVAALIRDLSYVRSQDTEPLAVGTATADGVGRHPLGVAVVGAPADPGSVASTFDLLAWPRHSRVKRFSSSAAKLFSSPPVDLQAGVDEGVDQAPVGW